MIKIEREREGGIKSIQLMFFARTSSGPKSKELQSLWLAIRVNNLYISISRIFRPSSDILWVLDDEEEKEEGEGEK